MFARSSLFHTTEASWLLLSLKFTCTVSGKDKAEPTSIVGLTSETETTFFSAIEPVLMYWKIFALASGFPAKSKSA